jgi:hypothetical protein
MGPVEHTVQGGVAAVVKDEAIKLACHGGLHGMAFERLVFRELRAFQNSVPLELSALARNSRGA